MARGRMNWAWVPLAILLVATGCASTPELGGDPQIKVMAANEMPAPDRVDLTAPSTPYYVGPYDKLTIEVFGIPELARREVQVDASGRVSYPLAGIIDVSGKTPGEIEVQVAQALRSNYIRDPQVTVNLNQALGQLLTIEGQVAKPGQYPVIGRMTLLRAMAVAGGTTEFSKLEDVVIFRTVQGQRLAALYDLKAIRHGKFTDPDVYANDVVMVGDATGRRLFRDILATVPLLTGPLIIAIDRLAK